MNRQRVAVVLFNLGGPDAPGSVRPFLFNLFNDPSIIGLPAPARWAAAQLISRRREKPAQQNYALMGGASPLLKETRAQAEALTDALEAAAPELHSRVFIAMRYWKPLTADVAHEVAAFAPDIVVLLPLYPQFSGTTTGSSLAAWRRSYRGPGEIRTVCCYPDAAGLVQAHAESIRVVWDRAGRPERVRLLFSAHGLPERVVAEGDPYQWQVERSCAAVVAALGEDWDWQVCYQSRVGPMRWLGPATPNAIRQAASDKLGVIVSPIAFVSEHIETLVELDHDYARLAAEVGCSFYLRVPALGTAPAFIDALAQATLAALARSAGVESGCGARLCGLQWSKCPAQLPGPNTQAEAA